MTVKQAEQQSSIKQSGEWGLNWNSFSVNAFAIAHFHAAAAFLLKVKVNRCHQLQKFGEKIFRKFNIPRQRRSWLTRFLIEVDKPFGFFSDVRFDGWFRKNSFSRSSSPSVGSIDSKKSMEQSASWLRLLPQRFYYSRVAMQSCLNNRCLSRCKLWGEPHWDDCVCGNVFPLNRDEQLKQPHMPHILFVNETKVKTNGRTNRGTEKSKTQF